MMEVVPPKRLSATIQRTSTYIIAVRASEFIQQLACLSAALTRRGVAFDLSTKTLIEIRRLNIMTEGKIIEQVTEFKYLGNISE
jgi:hypothetical protein